MAQRPTTSEHLVTAIPKLYAKVAKSRKELGPYHSEDIYQTNYPAWAFRMRALFLAEGLWFGIIVSGLGKAPTTDEEVFAMRKVIFDDEDFVDKDNKALLLISVAIDDAAVGRISNYTRGKGDGYDMTAMEAWMELERVYGGMHRKWDAYMNPPLTSCPVQ
ncbi:hypothetical protein BJ508DRAFT_308749 [Ascobolus immersus RN42]|uniref:DUF4219 domain-containing protein n=1 Tax=Ascobolus immersus RN42 TaxID=1160509 RepID=A0A3N4I2W8_ASCIM|nr:hypothetical protein BJ508DRAFT_308749 [Ascobolus immersus RN42]